MTYTYARRIRSAQEELEVRWALADAECSERQAENGPYFPEYGITRETLTAYAQKLRAQVATLAKGRRT